MNKKSELDEVTLIGKLDLYDDPETGTDLVAVYTDDGEEYVINNRKMARKLMKYTEDDIDIRFTGFIKEDPFSHIQVLTVMDFELLQEFKELKTHGEETPRRHGASAHFTDDELAAMDDEEEFIPDEDDCNALAELDGGNDEDENDDRARYREESAALLAMVSGEDPTAAQLDAAPDMRGVLEDPNGDFRNQLSWEAADTPDEQAAAAPKKTRKKKEKKD